MGPRRSALLVLAVLSALALWCAAPALSLEPAGDGWYWQSPQPQGQLLNDVTFGDMHNVWAVGDGGTILHSADAGVTWARQTAPTLEPLRTVVFTDADRGWVCGGRDGDADGISDLHTGVILATSDGGVTWRTTKELSSAVVMDLAFVDPLHGWAVGSGGLLLHTVDGGQTWTEQASGVRRSLLCVTFSDDRHGVIGGARGLVLVTTDGGDTWRRSSTQRAGLWIDVSSLLVGSDGTIWAGMGDRGMSGDFPRIAASTTAGRTWRTVRVGYDYEVWDLAADGDRVLGVGPRGDSLSSSVSNPVSRVIVGDAAGQAWTPHVIGATAQLAAVASDGEGTLCAVGDCIVTSADHGATWFGRTTHPVGVDDIDMVTSRDGWALTGGPASQFSWLNGRTPRQDTVLQHTTDGVRWEERWRERRGLFAVDFVDAATGWVAGEGGLLRRTTDGGATWTRQASGVTGPLVDVVASSSSAAWAGGYDIQRKGWPGVIVLKTTDAGATWSRVPVPGSFFPFGFEFLDPTHAWLTGASFDGESMSPFVLRTDDGATWQTQSLAALLPARAIPYSVDFVDENDGWLIAIDEMNGTPTVLRTTDGGDTWLVAAGPGAFGGEIVGAVRFVDPLEGWASGSAIFHTTDGGVTWTRQVAGLSGLVLSLVATDATHAWAGGDYLLSTVDSGKDVAAPVTLSDVPGEWSRSRVAIHLTAADVGGAGLVSTEYRVDDGAWTPGLEPPAFPAPADHSGDGSHSVDYRSTDADGNVEPIQTVAVRIDTVRPVVRLGRCTVGRDRVLRLRLRIDDRSCPAVSEIGFVIRDRKGHAFGSASFSGGRLHTDRWVTLRRSHWGWMSAGSYEIALITHDLAGNKSAPAKGILVVKRRPGARTATVSPAGHAVARSVVKHGPARGFLTELRAALERLGL